MRLLPALGALTALATHALGGLATADTDQAPWATINGNCSRGGTVTNQTGRPAADHPYPIARFTPEGGPGTWIAGGVGPVVGFAAGDVAWGAMDPISKQQSPASKTSCPESVQSTFKFRVEFFDAPVAPATFTGRITRVNDNQWGSILVFLAPATSLYAADVELRSGAARFCVYTPGRDFSGGAQPKVCSTVRETSTIPLGTVEQGPTVVSVMAEPGAPADYVLKLRPTASPPPPAPIVVPGSVRLTSRYLKPGSTTAMSFGLSDATTVSAAVRDAAGRTVRSLAAGRALPAGASSLSWDGRDDAGRQAPDGRYTVRLAADGTPETSSPPITVDGTRPTVAVSSPVTSRGSATVRVADALSGVARAVVKAGPLAKSRTLATYTGRESIRVSAPRGGWKPGAKLHVVAIDRAGNARKLMGRVTLRRDCAAVAVGSRRLTEVTARGTSCVVARGVARAGGGVEPRYVASGFTCVRSKGARYSCSRRADRITFRVR